MQRLKEIVNLYLSMDTSYALMITGEWGTGKTYYFKNVLAEDVSKISVYGDSSKTYRPLIISLFGLKSIEEIQTQILLSIFPLLKNKLVKLGASVAKSLAKGILQFKNLDYVYDNISEVKVDKGDWINFEDLVICFDDLERISEQLKIEELIGYINSLVENENVKIIIIANEDKIDTPQYRLLKEKVIGNTIVFNPVFGETFDSVVNTKFSGFHSYKDFLDANKNYILDVFLKKSSNLRILIFALNYYHNIFSIVNKNLFKDESLKESKDRILLNLLKFTLSISIEYKLENINYKSRQNIDNTQSLTILELMRRMGTDNKSGKVDKEEKSYSEKFLETYYKGDNYIFYTTIYDFLTGGAGLGETELVNEIKKVYHIEKKEILPQYEVFSKLHYTDCFSLSDEEYLKLTRQMLEYAYAGGYDLPTCYSSFHFITRFNNPMRRNIDRVVKGLITGMRKSKPKLTYTGGLGNHLSFDDNSEFKQHFLELRNEALRINEVLEQESKQKESKLLEELCYEDFEKFYQKVLDKNEAACYQPILSTFNPFKFYSLFLNSIPKKKWEIVGFIRSRNYLTSFHKEELPFYEKLIEKVTKKNAKLKGSNISGFLWSDFEQVLKEQLEKSKV